MNRRLSIAAGALVLVLAIPATSLAAPASSAFTGSWESTDFDGSHQTLVISAGSRPSVVFQDFYASSCDGNGNPSSHWTSAGWGQVEGDYLWIAYRKSGCGTFLQGGYEDYYVYDSGTDTLIDSVDNVWTRTR